MARAKGEGTVVTVGKKFRARKRRAGCKDIVGPLRLTRKAAADDLPNLKWDEPVQTLDPKFGEWAHLQMDPETGTYAKSIDSKTWKLYDGRRVNHLNTSPLASMRLSEIKRPHAQAFARNIKKVGGGQPSPGMVHGIVAFLSGLFSIAIDEGLVEVNPFSRLTLPAIPERVNRILAPEEVADIIENPRTRTECMVAVAVTTGFRNSEVRLLERSKVKVDHIEMKGTKGNKIPANIPLLPAARAAIERQPILLGCKYVFYTKNGKPVCKAYFDRQWAKLKKVRGLPEETRIQDLRGTYGTMLIESGADIKTVQTLLRHSSPATTMKWYLRSRPETQRKAALDMYGWVLKERKA